MSKELNSVLEYGAVAHTPPPPFATTSSQQSVVDCDTESVATEVWLDRAINEIEIAKARAKQQQIAAAAANNLIAEMIWDKFHMVWAMSLRYEQLEGRRPRLELY